MRPIDWFLVELPVDPTPGDAFGIRSLAAKYAAIADIAGEGSVGVRNARSSGAASAWIGDAGDIFREKSERMPGELAKANDSYELVADALRAWANALDDAQAQADRGLALARTAHADLMAAQSTLLSAQRSWTTLAAQQLTYDVLQKSYANVPPPPGLSMPTPDQLRSLSRSAQSTRSSLASAHAQVTDADARLAAARTMVLEAKSRRDDAERAAVHAIRVAGDHAVQPSSIWEAIQDSAAWRAIVQVATVVLTIVSIVAIFVGGPLVWALILAATILLVVNALLSIAQGKDAWGELALLAVGLIPGGAVLGITTRVIGITNRVATIARSAAMVRSVIETSQSVRIGASASTRIVVLEERTIDASSPVARDLLAESLAIEEGISAGGIAIAGRGTSTGIRVVDRLVTQYGGEAADWTKMVSKVSHDFPSGTTGQAHWYQNLVEGLNVEGKVKW